jgi:diaminopimelate epimerase
VRIAFAKMEGAGNDFVVIADDGQGMMISHEVVVRLCDRHTGIGGDGLLLLARYSEQGDSCFRAQCFNADGSRIITCLNAFRCAARRAAELAWTDDDVTFDTDRGSVSARVRRNVVALDFEPPELRLVSIDLPVGSPSAVGSLVSLGDPHLVVVLDETSTLADIDFAAVARPLRHWPVGSSDGANVHFIAKAVGGYAIRSFERGVEDETMACGSGCVAATMALADSIASRAVPFMTRSGQILVVSPGAARWSITGAARTVFTGVLSDKGWDVNFMGREAAG